MAAPQLILGQVAITVSNMARATAFYRDKVGLPFLFTAGGMAFFDCGGIRLMLSASNAGSEFSSILYYKTDEIEALSQVMQVRGVVFEQAPRMIAKMPDHELWMAFFQDSEGNLAALMSEVR